MPSRSSAQFLLWLTVVALAGCGHSPGASSSSDAPTWYRDVEPIVSEHCVSCHEPGGVAGVSLEFPADNLALYQSSKPLFADAVGVLDAGQMPLWLADRACRHYDDERGVSDAQKDVFRAFVKAGSLRGDPSDAPPAFVSAPLSHVDAALAPSSAYLPVATAVGGNADSRCFVLDPTLTVAQDVVGFDLRPGSKRVHRAALFAMQPELAQALDQADAGLGYACSTGPGAQAALVAEYVPGVPAQNYPAGTGVRLEPGSLLVLQIVYDLSSGDPEPDQSEVDLEYSASPVPHPARFEAITNDSFSIPARAADFMAQATFSATQPSTLWGVAPHLGSYGRQAHMALTQAGADACLVDVPNWDPSWEQSYFFSSPASLSLAPGDSIALTCTWDNPSEVAVVSGMGPSDEACVGYAYLSDD
jgi:hypothetical protein